VIHISTTETSLSRVKRIEYSGNSPFLAIKTHITQLTPQIQKNILDPVINEIRNYFYPTEQIHLTMGSKEFPITLMSNINGIFKNIKSTII
jgi:hypothetical protein